MATLATTLLAAIMGLTAGPGNARAADGVSVELGRSTSSYTDLPLARIGVQWNWKGRLWEAGGGHLRGYWDLSAGYLRNDSDPRIRTSSGIVDVALTPTLRWTQPLPGGPAGFVDLGVGLHWLSEDSVTTLRDLSSQLQVGSTLGLGVQFGSHREYEVGYRVQHLSNGGLRQPNSGLNLQSIRFQYHF